MQKHEVKVEWNDGLEKDLFSRRGLDSFDSFWALERSGADIEYKDVRTHRDKRSGRVIRQIACIKFEQNIKYFLKRGEGIGYESVRREFEAFSVVGRFGFKPARIVAHSFDDGGRRAFILMKNIAGCICLDDVVNGRVPPETMAKYKIREKDTLTRLAANILSYQRAGFCYPDIEARRIFVNPSNSELHLVGLERFGRRARLSFLCMLPFAGRLLHHLERRRLLKTLSSHGNAARELMKLFRKGARPDA